MQSDPINEWYLVMKNKRSITQLTLSNWDLLCIQHCSSFQLHMFTSKIPSKYTSNILPPNFGYSSLNDVKIRERTLLNQSKHEAGKMWVKMGWKISRVHVKSTNKRAHFVQGSKSFKETTQTKWQFSINWQPFVTNRLHVIWNIRSDFKCSGPTLLLHTIPHTNIYCNNIIWDRGFVLPWDIQCSVIHSCWWLLHVSRLS